MAAISKSKKKQNKKKEEERRRLEEEAQEENELEFQKACLEIRVKELETLNKGLRQKCSYLETQNEILQTQLDETKEDKDSLVSHLTRKLSEQLTISKELEERLVGMQKARLDDKKEFHTEFEKKKVEFKEMKEGLEENIQALELRLAAIDDFQVNKTIIEKTLEELKKTLTTEREIYLTKYNELERKIIIYREQVKNDAIDTLINLAKDVQEIGKVNLHSTIKSAISTNIRLNEEKLSMIYNFEPYLNTQLEKVSESNLKLRTQIQTLTHQLNQKNKLLKILKSDKQITSKKCAQFRKVLELSIEKQLELIQELKSIDSIKNELNTLKSIHSKCKTTEEIEIIIQEEMEIIKESKEEEKKIQIANDTKNIIEELKKLQIILINTAIVSSDMVKAETTEELEYLKAGFKSMIVKIYETVCGFPNLSNDLKTRLMDPFPIV